MKDEEKELILDIAEEMDALMMNKIEQMEPLDAPTLINFVLNVMATLCGENLHHFLNNEEKEKVLPNFFRQIKSMSYCKDCEDSKYLKSDLH